MPDQPPTPPSGNPATPTPSSPRPRNDQDAQIANDISGSLHVIKLLQNDATIRTPLVPRGFDTQKINTGQALQTRRPGRLQRTAGGHGRAGAMQPELE